MKANKDDHLVSFCIGAPAKLWSAKRPSMGAYDESSTFISDFIGSFLFGVGDGL